MNGTNHPNQINVTVEDLPGVKCENCQHEVFVQGVTFREVSALLSRTGQEELVQIPVFVCGKCNEVLERLLPEKLRKKRLVA